MTTRPDTARKAGSTAQDRPSALRTHWLSLQQRFDQLQPRERLMLIVAGMAVALMAADTLWLDPALKSFRAARQQQLAAQATLQTMQADIARLAGKSSQQVNDRQAELASWRQRVHDGEAALREHEDTLVGPDQMVDLLGHLLARHGQVRVRAMQSLGRSDLLAPVGSNAAAPASPAASAAPAAPARGDAGPSLYRHGVELVLEGGFVDLLSYLQALETLPQRVLWGSVSLKVEQHPKCVLTLRVYTISRERHWLEI